MSGFSGLRRIGFALLAVVLLTAAILIAIALYYRWQFSKIAENRARQQPAHFDSKWDDHRGAIHVHTRAGGHTEATREEMLQAARLLDLDFVGLTEHLKNGGPKTGPVFDSKKPLLLAGLEMGREGHRELVFEGVDRTELSIATHWKDTVVDNPAVEIFNLHEEAEAAGRFQLALSWLGSLDRYSQYLLMPHLSVYRSHLRDWDRMTQSRSVIAIAGNDAHANIGYRSGRRTMLLDPYERSFGYVSNHVWIERGVPLNRQTLLEALRQGHVYVAFDFLGSARGFYFAAAQGDSAELSVLAGGQAALPARLRVRSPLKARIVLIKNGKPLQQVDSLGLDFTASEPGVYRVELYQRQLGGYAEDHPWILSNPIYVK